LCSNDLVVESLVFHLLAIWRSNVLPEVLYMRLTFFDGTGVAMDNSIVTVTICILQVASFNLHREGVTNLGPAIWLLGDLLGVLYSWWAFFDHANVAMDSSVVTVTTRMLQIASFNLHPEGVTNLGLAI